MRIGEAERDQIYSIIKDKQFVLRALDPRGWGLHATALRRAADHLIRAHFRERQRFLRKLSAGEYGEQDTPNDIGDQMLARVYLMLMGFAIENLLKGILMYRNPEYLKPHGRIVKDTIDSHDTRQLCRDCASNLTAAEEELLGELEEYVTWRGRYPVPLFYLDMLPRRKPDRTWKEERTHVTPAAKRELDRLYSKFLKVAAQHRGLPPLPPDIERVLRPRAGTKKK